MIKATAKQKKNKILDLQIRSNKQIDLVLVFGGGLFWRGCFKGKRRGMKHNQDNTNDTYRHGPIGSLCQRKIIFFPI